MIIYGTRGTELAKETLFDSCPNCGTKNSVEMHVFQRYAHIFWIPLFPIGKTAVSQCNHCKQVLQLKQMPPGLVNTYDRLKAESKTPVWTFAGLALFAILISLGILTDKNRHQRNAKLILSPQNGDVFEIKTKDNQYTLYKIEQVNKDSVLVLMNNYETDKLTGLSQLREKGPSAYSEAAYPFSKAELKTMLEKGEIVDIDRY
ncbi:MAG TPA: zinc-ribbon domain-containing protein [Chitinophagaceae bacterium]|nr:zinc-ribbon domain-containing protein [Chitinophagaceae bacterium]